MNHRHIVASVVDGIQYSPVLYSRRHLAQSLREIWWVHEYETLGQYCGDRDNRNCSFDLTSSGFKGIQDCRVQSTGSGPIFPKRAMQAIHTRRQRRSFVICPPPSSGVANHTIGMDKEKMRKFLHDPGRSSSSNISG